MSAVIDAISDVVDTVISIVATAIAATLVVFTAGLILLSPEFNTFVLGQLEVIMSLLGINEEDIIETFVNDSRLLPDTNQEAFITKLALEHQAKQHSIISLFSEESSAIRESFRTYYDNGVEQYSDGLPTTSINSEILPANLNTYIDTEYGITSIILEQELDVPTKDEYLTYRLYNSYNYYPVNGTLNYLGEDVVVGLTEYNFTTDQYDIIISRGSTISVRTITTITPVDAVNDNKNVEVITTSTYDTGGVVVTSLVTDTLIPIGTEVDSDVTDPDVAGFTDFTLHEPAFAAVRNYVVKYYADTLSEPYFLYWVYELGTGGIPELDDANLSKTSLEMLPIIEVKRSTVNVNEDKLSPRYLETQEILGLIGLDLDEITDSIDENPDIASIEDVYIYFGLDIQDKSPLVAKMMYDLFEFMFNDETLANEGSSYKALTTEGSFNAALVWEKQSRVIHAGSIGPIGTHSITTGIDISVSRQETADQYVTYTMTYMSAITFIDRGGLWGVTVRHAADETDTIVIPLSYFFVDNLTPLEQMDIFNRSIRLSVYSAVVTHLEWYETEAFFDLISVVVTVVGAVLTILSIWAGGAAGTAWYVIAGQILLMYGGALAIKLLMEQTDIVFLKALIAVVGVILLSQVPGSTDQASIFLSADLLTTGVNQYTLAGFEDLQDSIEEFQEESKLAYERLEDVQEENSDYLSTSFVAELATGEESTASMQSVSENMFKAIEMQYSWDLVNGSASYATAFDYDKYYDIGI